MSKLIVARDTNHAKQLSKLYRQNQIRKIYRGIYTDNLIESIENIVLRHWMEIVSHIVSEGILSFRTAFDLKPTPFKGQHIVFITSSYAKSISLPGLIINITNGNNKEFVDQLLPYLTRSNTARMLLENLIAVRGDYKNIKTIGIAGVENFLAKELSLRHEKTLNEYRDASKLAAECLGYQGEYLKLNTIIGALLNTNSPDSLTSPYAKAIVKNEPFDHNRIKLFENMVIYLKKCRFMEREFNYNKSSFKNISFFESYFSNSIEGTEFIIDEAEDIVFQGKEIENRHADSHDIMANFNLSNDYSEMNITPQSPKELINILQRRHAYLMRERPEKFPGEFKKRANKAGNTYFVSPNEVIGTLYQGFEFYCQLQNGMEKALFMHFLISEVHPFEDGNGRLARIMMNAELVYAGLFKIIIPSAHRDNYLNGLRMASRNDEFRVYCKSIDQAQAYVASINWQLYAEAREKIENDCANLTSDEGLPAFNRALRILLLSDLPD